MRTLRIPSRIALGALLLALVALPAAAVDLVIDSGLDIWATNADGTTFFTFREDPLPADFFCAGSEPFADQIVFKGVPVATYPEGILGRTDTIVQRLDDAVFDADGVAVTRLQIRALHFEGTDLLRNSCGAFRVEVKLDGEQPITEMRIFREGEGFGHFEAEVAVHSKLIFTPANHKGPVLEIARHVTFPPRRNSLWANRPGEGGLRYEGFLVVDTDSDGQPDTYLPGTSRNFAAGWPGPRERGEVLRRRQELAQSGPEVAGSLKGAPTGEILMPAVEGITNTAGAQILCADNCHCDAGCGNHCLTTTVSLE